MNNFLQSLGKRYVSMKSAGTGYTAWEFYKDFTKSTDWNIHTKQAHALGLLLKGFVVLSMKV